MAPPRLFLLHVLLVSICVTAAFVPVPLPWGNNRLVEKTALAMDLDNVVDAEFERVPAMTNEDGDERKKQMSTMQREEPKSLIDISLDMDARFKELRVPFVDAKGQGIECKLAFTLKLDGVLYGLGVPHDHPVFIIIEGGEDDEQTTLVDPDDPENEELMQIMAGALTKYMSEDLKLVRTPKVLTVQGDLNNFTENWEESMFGDFANNITMEKLLATDKATEEEFLDHMRDVLGEEEVLKVLNGEDDDDDEEWAQFEHLFNDLADIGGKSEAENEWLSNLQKMDPQSLSQNLDGIVESKNDVGLKLVGFRFKNGKFYSLVKPFEHVPIIGKHLADREELMFSLLSKADDKIILPRLEELAKESLEDAGMDLEKALKGPGLPMP